MCIIPLSFSFVDKLFIKSTSLCERTIFTCQFCYRSMNGCKGADPASYVSFFAANLKGQSVHEGNYPYLNTDPKLICPAGNPIYNSGAYVSASLPDYRCDENKLKMLVATYGAAVTGVYANDLAFSNYGGGVFEKCTAHASDHAVLVVGYGTDPVTRQDYWIIKNSWGSGSWGESGYMRLKRGVGMCNVGQMCVAAKCAKTTGPLSDPPIVPPPPPIPVKFDCDMTKSIGYQTGSFTLTSTTSTGNSE